LEKSLQSIAESMSGKQFWAEVFLLTLSKIDDITVDRLIEVNLIADEALKRYRSRFYLSKMANSRGVRMGNFLDSETVREADLVLTFHRQPTTDTMKVTILKSRDHDPKEGKIFTISLEEFKSLEKMLI
jgi:hypothetical protein